MLYVEEGEIESDGLTHGLPDDVDTLSVAGVRVRTVRGMEDARVPTILTTTVWEVTEETERHIL